MKLLFTITLFFLTAFCFAQRQNIYFLKDNGAYVKVRDSADYIRVVREPDSGSTLYNLFEFYPNGVNKLTGKSSVIDPPKMEGQCIKFYKNGKKQSIANYKRGVMFGDSYEFYPNGKLYLVKHYPEEMVAEDHLQNIYLINAENDSTGVELVKNGDGYYKGYNDKFSSVTEEGTVKNGNRDGLWKGADFGLKIKYIEAYSGGKLVSGISIGDKGDSIRYSTREIEPQYKGGLNAFYKYVGRNVKYPDYERDHNIQGKVILTFIVEKTGEISNIKVLSPVSENIDQEAVRVIANSPKWIAGMAYGRNVRVYYSLPLNFALNN